MPMFDDDLRYAISRIRGTFMLPVAKDKPLAYIAEIHSSDSDRNSLSRATIIDDKGVSWKIKDFLFAPGKLGYVETLEGEPMYVTRMPLRQDWRQGIRAQQLVYLSRGSSKGVGTAWLNTHRQAIADCFRGKFPNFMKAMESVEERGVTVPVSRRFAISRNYDLMYRNKKVGRVGRNDSLILGQKFEFLQQDLEKAVGSENVSK